MKLLLSTDVIIDYLGRREPYFDDAASVIAMGYFGDAELWAPAQSFKDAFAVLVRHVDSTHVQKAILALMELVHPVDLTGLDVASAARLKWQDLEACLVAISAGKAGVDYLVTRNECDFTRSMTAPITPTELLAKTRNEKGLQYRTIDLPA